MNFIDYNSYNDFVESKIMYYRDIYENGPKLDDPNSIEIHDAFIEIKQQDSEGYSADQFVVDFTEGITSKLDNIKNFREKGWCDNELLIAINLFKDVSRNLYKISTMTSPESLVPYALRVYNKTCDYLTRDKNNHEFDNHPQSRFINEFRKHLHKAIEITSLFLSQYGKKFVHGY